MNKDFPMGTGMSIGIAIGIGIGVSPNVTPRRNRRSLLFKEPSRQPPHPPANQRLATKVEPGGKADACLYAGLHVLVLALATYYYYYYSYSCGCCYYCYTTAAVLEMLPGCRQNGDGER